MLLSPDGLTVLQTETIARVSHVPTGLPWLTDDTPPPCSEPQMALIFDEAGEMQNPRSAQRAAKTVCATCPYFRPCRDWGVRHSEAWGVWGGLNRSERKREALRLGITGPRDPGLDDA